jgi:hypothetical protein
MNGMRVCRSMHQSTSQMHLGGALSDNVVVAEVKMVSDGR